MDITSKEFHSSVTETDNYFLIAHHRSSENFLSWVIITRQWETNNGDRYCYHALYAKGIYTNPNPCMMLRQKREMAD